MLRHESGVRCHASEFALIIFLSEMPLSEAQSASEGPIIRRRNLPFSLSAQTEKVNL